MPAWLVMYRQVASENAMKPSGAAGRERRCAGLGGVGAGKRGSSWKAVPGLPVRHAQGRPQACTALRSKEEDRYTASLPHTLMPGFPVRGTCQLSSIPANRQPGRHHGADPCLGWQCPGARRRECSGRWSVGSGRATRAASALSRELRGDGTAKRTAAQATALQNQATHVPPHELGDAVHAVNHQGLAGG